MRHRLENRPFRLLRIAACCVALGALTAGCPSSDTAPAAVPEDLRVTRGDIERRLLLTGELEAVEAVHLTVPRTPQWRLQIQTLAEDGAEVRQGDVVVQFDNSSFTASLDASRSAVERARRTLLQTRAQVETRLLETRLAVERTRIALEKARLDASVPENLRSRYEHATAQLALERAATEHAKALEDRRAAEVKAENDVRIQQEALSKAERELETAERAISALELRAPVDGIVVVGDHPWEGRTIQTGDTVWVGLTVASIPDLSRMRIAARLPDVDDGLVEVGTRVRCLLDTYPDRQLGGTVERVTRVAQQEPGRSLRRSFDVGISLEETPTDLPLVPGMSVRIEVPVRTLEDVLVAPRAALDIGPDACRARLASGEWRQVEVGACDAQQCEVVRGLEPGDRLQPASAEAG